MRDEKKRKCINCLTIKTLDEFYYNKSRGTFNKCKKCIVNQNNNKRKETPIKNKIKSIIQILKEKKKTL